MVSISQLINLIYTNSVFTFSTRVFISTQAQSPTPASNIIPPSAGANWIQTMIGAAIVTVLIVVIGVWINRSIIK
jgi:hypothetical protein